MSVSERDAVLRERAAFMAGVEVAFEHHRGPPRSWRGSRHVAAERYPLPKVRRPREVLDPSSSCAQWSVRGGGRLQVDVGAGWMEPDGSWKLTPERVRLWADLLTNPTEEVEE